MQKIKRFFRNEEGVTMVEYALMLGFIAAVCVAVVGTLGTAVEGLFRSVIPGF